MSVCIIFNYCTYLRTLMFHVVFVAPSIPDNLTANKDLITDTTVVLSWKHSNQKNISYYVQYRKPGEDYKTVKDISELSYEVTKLSFNTEYEFRVAAFDSVLGPYTKVVTQFTSKYFICIILYS